MEFLFEILIQVVGEFVLQIVLEVLVEAGLHTLSEPFRKPPNPWLAALGYAMLGAIAGVVSVLAFPALFLHSEGAQIANLLLTPFACGAAMTALGAWRARRGQDLVRLDRFAYGYLFALAMAAVRFGMGD